MSTGKLITQNKGLSNVLFTTHLTKRSFLKHLFLVGYVILITIIIFHFDVFKMAIQTSWKSNTNIVLESSSVLQAAKSNLCILIWDILLVIIEVRLLKRTLRILHYSNKNIYVFIFFSIVFFSYGIFIASYLPNWFENKLNLLKDNEWIKGFKVLSEFFNYYLAVPIASALWYFSNSLYERKVSPFICKIHLVRGIILVFWSLMVGTSSWLANLLLLGNRTVSFDYTDNFQMFLILSISTLALLTLFGNLYVNFRYGKSIDGNYTYKNIIQSISIALIFPLAIWFMVTYFKFNGNWMKWLYISIVFIILLMIILYSIFAKQEFASPRIFMILMSLALTIIWMCKFFFEYFWGYEINQQFTLPIAILCSAIIFLIIYIKSPNSSRFSLYLISRFIKLLWIIALASWAIEFVPYVEKILPFIPELINVLLMSLPIFIFTSSVLYWYFIQWRIKHFVTINREGVYA